LLCLYIMLNKIRQYTHRQTPNYQPLHAVSLMLLFFALFDGIVSYLTPLIITQAGFSNTMLGIIIGSSSVAGALFDIYLSKYLKSTHFRRMYLLMFIFCFLYPLLLWNAKTIWLYLIAMAIWGFYHDLKTFGNFDFVGRKIKPKEHASSFGIMWVFKQVGYILSPIIAGFVIGNLIDLRPIFLMYFYLFTAFIFYLLLVFITRKNQLDYIKVNIHKPLSFLLEIHLWKRIGKLLLPVLILTTLLNIVDSFFWTLGPLIAQKMDIIKPFNGLFIAAYTLPTILVGWFVGSITNKLGKKRTAYITFLMGSATLGLFAFVQTPLLLIIIIFTSSIFMSISWPAINGAYADYISESSKVEKEIEALENFSGNAGYVIGPIIAGILSDHIGYGHAFTLLGFTCAAITIILLKITPKKIKIPTR